MESKLDEVDVEVEFDSEIPLVKKKKKGTFNTFFNYQVKEYEKNLIHKLPNELRSYVINYNYRASSDEHFHIDTNDY